MNRLLCALACLLIAGCTGLNSGRVDHRNFAIDTYYPIPNEARLAEARARDYGGRNASRLGSEPRYLAVNATLVFPQEVQDLWPKLMNSETTSSVFGHGTQDLSLSDFVLYGIVIFDTTTGHLVRNAGCIVADLPPRGSVARFGDYFARYIGNGS